MKGDTHKRKKVKVGSLMAYLFRAVIKARLIVSNMGLTEKAIARAIAALCAMRPEIERPIQHITLSPNKSDSISQEKWEAIARAAIVKMGLPSGWPVAVVKHLYRDNRPEPHLHIVLPHIGDAGARLDRPPSAYRIMKIAAEIEAEFGLVPSPKKNGST